MADNSYTKNYQDGSALTETQLDAAYKSLKLDISNTTQMTQGATAGHYLKCVTPGSAAQFAALPSEIEGINSVKNIGLKCTAATGILTFTLTTGAGTAPSSSDPAIISFSSNGTTQATLQSINVTTTKTFAISASASLGTQSTSASFVYVYALKNGTSSAGVLLGASRKGDLDCGESVTTVAMSSSSDSYDVLYATAALTIMPRLLGWAQVARNSTGSWQTPLKVNLNQGVGKLSPSSDQQARSSVTGTGTTVKIGGVALSTSSGNFSTTSATGVISVTNLSVNITTSGRPLFVGLVSDASGNESYINSQRETSGSSYETNFIIYRGATEISRYQISVSESSGSASLKTNIPAGALYHIDAVAAGTYTYSVSVEAGTTGTRSRVAYCKLVAYEI